MASPFGCVPHPCEGDMYSTTSPAVSASTMASQDLQNPALPELDQPAASFTKFSSQSANHSKLHETKLIKLRYQPIEYDALGLHTSVLGGSATSSFHHVGGVELPRTFRAGGPFRDSGSRHQLCPLGRCPRHMIPLPDTLRFYGSLYLLFLQV